jgi:hypothetical protein
MSHTSQIAVAAPTAKQRAIGKYLMKETLGEGGYSKVCFSLVC